MSGEMWLTIAIAVVGWALAVFMWWPNRQVNKVLHLLNTVISKGSRRPRYDGRGSMCGKVTVSRGQNGEYFVETSFPDPNSDWGLSIRGEGFTLIDALTDLVDNYSKKKSDFLSSSAYKELRYAQSERRKEDDAKVWRITEKELVAPPVRDLPVEDHSDLIRREMEKHPDTARRLSRRASMTMETLVRGVIDSCIVESGRRGWCPGQTSNSFVILFSNEDGKDPIPIHFPLTWLTERETPGCPSVAPAPRPGPDEPTKDSQ